MKKMEIKKCIILANGKSPLKSVIKYFQNKNYSDLICADGGGNTALKLNLIPKYIIGDFDSISTLTLKHFSRSTEMIKIKRQNDTDVEKCLKFAVRNHYSEVILMGVTGNRLDHTFNNLGILIKYFLKIDLAIVAENSFLKAYNKNTILRTLPGETISIYGLNIKTKVTSSGLKYPLRNITLPFGIRDSTSNVSTNHNVILKIKNGAIFVIRDINFVMKNDLI